MMLHITRPAALDVSRAQAVLSAWAAETAMVDDRLFDTGVTRTADVSLMRCRLTRLVESRRVTHETGEGWRSLVAVGDWPRIPVPDDFVEQRFDFLVDGSVDVRECEGCHRRGSVTCTRCSGRGEESCPADETCVSCGGSGTSTSGENQTSCFSCGGSGRQRCHACDGFGHKQCSRCAGSGELTCPPCAGRGTVTHYDTFVLRRQVTRHEAEPAAQDSTVSPDRPVRTRQEDWEPAGVLEPAMMPDGLAGDDARTVGALLATPSPETVLRDRLEVSFARITEVTYERAGRRRQAWVVGAEHRVVAPDATRGRRLLVWAIVVLLSAALAVIALSIG